MKYSDVDIYVRQGTNTGGSGRRSGRGVFSLFITVAILLVIVIVIFVIPQLLSSNNDDVSYSGLGINYKYQKQGDGIYYSKTLRSGFSDGLWKVGIDGKEEVQVINGGVRRFAFYNNQILFTTRTTNGEWVLHISEEESKDERVLYTSKENSSHILKMDAIRDQCYMLDIENRLHVIDLDTGEHSVYDDYITDFCIDGEWIYYIKTKPDSGDKPQQLWRAEIEGTKQQQLMKSFESAVDYCDEKIYYIDDKDGDIYSIDFFGEKEHKVIETEGRFFLKVIGDWIYFENIGDNPGIYKVKLDGTKKQKISDHTTRTLYPDSFADEVLSISFVCILDNWLRYADTNDEGVDCNVLIRINDKYNSDYAIEEFFMKTHPSWVIRKFE